MQTAAIEKSGTSPSVKVYENLTPKVEVREVLRFLGARDGKATSRILKKIKSVIRESSNMLEPRVLLSQKTVLPSEDGRLKLSPGVEFKSPKLASTFRHCSTATVFVATVGEKVDRRIASLMKEKRSAEATILDAVASAAVEDTIETLHNRIDHQLKTREKCATLRFSPGYCDWNIKEQKKLFDIVDASKVGVSLSDNSLMSPRKSVSGVFGVGACGEIEGKVDNPCTSCSKTDCNARRI